MTGPDAVYEAAARAWRVDGSDPSVIALIVTVESFDTDVAAGGEGGT